VADEGELSVTATEGLREVISRGESDDLMTQTKHRAQARDDSLPNPIDFTEVAERVKYPPRLARSS
jgi:hypothetical protein